MQRRWLILALVFAARMNMGFQFQSVAALAPLIARDFAIGIADIGFLIGLYLSPGLFLALPSGAIGRRFGDKHMVLCGLVLMFAGGLIMAFGTSWSWQLAGRLIAGIGGVLLNVLMSKMVTDWFAGREIATAMAIFVNSWPAGIALALLVLPVIGTGSGVTAALLLTCALIAVSGAVFALVYAPPPGVVSQSGASAWPTGNALAALLVAGSLWGMFNGAFAMIFSFGATMLTERGWTLAEAGSMTSIVMGLSAISVPIGGFLADRTGRPLRVLIFGTIATAILMAAAVTAANVLPVFIGLGLVGGLAAGPVMSLPTRVLQPDTRAVGMGLFYTIFYACTMSAPWIAGLVAARAGSAGAAFYFGTLLLAAACVAVWIFTLLASPSRLQSAAPRAR